MSVYLISYDLNTPGQKYDEVIKKITSYNDHKKALLSAYLVNTTDTPKNIYDKISPSLDSNDRIIITGVTKDYFGFLNKDVIDWLSTRV